MTDRDGSLKFKSEAEYRKWVDGPRSGDVDKEQEKKSISDRRKRTQAAMAQFYRTTQNPDQATRFTNGHRQSYECMFSYLIGLIEDARRENKMVLDAVGEYLGEELEPLRTELEQVKAATTFVYKGVWTEGEQYAPGNFVTHSGCMWACLAETRSRPGTDRTWQLAVKRGRDGKDLTR